MFEAIRGVTQDCVSNRQVVLGRLDIRVAHVRSQPRQQVLHVAALGVPTFDAVDREGMSQVVQARPDARHMWLEAGRTQQANADFAQALQSIVTTVLSLEEGQIKLSSVVSDLLGASGYRILTALARGETDPVKLAALGDERLQASPEVLAEALGGQLHQVHRKLLELFLERLDLLERQREELEGLISEAMRDHQAAIARLCELPGMGVEAAHQVLAELGPQAESFPSAGQVASWVGVCPGRQESAGESHSDRSPKGNRPMRRLLNQLAWAAVRCKGSYFQDLFRRLLPRLGVKKAIWAVAHRLLKLIWKILHQEVDYVEYGARVLHTEARRRRKQRLVRELRRLGYAVEVSALARSTTP